MFCTSTIQSLTDFTQCEVIGFSQEEEKKYLFTHNSVMHLCKIIPNMSLTAMGKTFHVITKDNETIPPFI